MSNPDPIQPMLEWIFNNEPIDPASNRDLQRLHDEALELLNPQPPTEPAKGCTCGGTNASHNAVPTPDQTIPNVERYSMAHELYCGYSGIEAKRFTEGFRIGFMTGQQLSQPTRECYMCGELITGNLKEWYHTHRCKPTSSQEEA